MQVLTKEEIRHDLVTWKHKLEQAEHELEKFKWHCVHDQPPLPETAVLAASKDQVSEMWFNHKSKFDLPRDDGFTDDYDLHFIKGITHWMPLPKLNN